MDAPLFCETPWETRNIGIQSFALSDRYWTDPNFVQLLDEMTTLRDKYGEIFLLARIGQQSIPFSASLEKLGFYLVECTVDPYCNLLKNKFLQRFRAYSETFLPRKFQQRDISVITLERGERFPRDELQKIAADSFVADRFHVDPGCGEERANQRFAYWVDDLIADSAVQFDVLQVDGKEMVGFMARKKSYLILAGFRKRYSRAGLGDYLWHASALQVLQEGEQLVNTRISMNNLSVVNLYIRLGYKFRNTQYSFHNWLHGKE